MVCSEWNGYCGLYFHHQIPQRIGALYIMSTLFKLTTSPLYKLAFLVLMISVSRVSAQDTSVAFTGEKTSWYEGFDRYDYLMDEQTFALTPILAKASETFGA